MRGAVQVEIIGHEAVAPRRQILLLDDRVASLNDFDVAASRPNAGGNSCGLPQWANSQDVDFGQRQRGLPDTPRLGGDGRSQFGKQAPLDLDDFLLRVEHLGSYSFSSGVVKRSAFTSVCLRS